MQTSAGARLTWLDAAFLFLSPVAAWAALDINLINQNTFVDPWIYTGYGQIFESLVRVYGWPYYAVRFPVVFLNSVCCSGAAPVLGYGLLRYALVLLAGIPLYLFTRRHFGRPIAICAYLFLFCNALFLRVLLWDLTPFVSVPAALAGIAIWMLADKHRWLGSLVAGALFAASISAHVYTATAIGCFLVVEITFALGKAQRRRKLVPDLAFAALGAAIMVALGVVYYRARVGEYHPMLFLSANWGALKAGSVYSAAHALPFSIWAATSTYVYVPLILLGAIAGLWRAQLRSSLDHRILWFFVLYCGFYLFHRFVIGSFVLETFYYFGHLTVALPLAVVLVVSLLARTAGSSVPVAVAFSVGLLLPLFALRMAIERVTAFLSLTTGDFSRMSVFWVLSALLLILLGTRRLPPKAVWLAAFCLAISIQFATLVEPNHRAVFDHRVIATERGIYITAVQYSRFVARYAEQGRPVLVWYPREEIGLSSASFVTLGDAVNDPFFAGPAMPTIGKRELDRLVAPALHYVMLLARSPQDIAGGKAALDKAGIRFRVVESRHIGDSAYSAIAELVEIIRPAS